MNKTAVRSYERALCFSLAAREHRFNFRIYRQDLTTVQGVAAYSASSVRSSSSCRAASKAAWTLGATAGPS